MVGECLPSSRRRFEIRDNLMETLNGQHVAHEKHAHDSLANWDTHGGAHLNLPQRAAEIPLPPNNGSPLPCNWRCDPVNWQYLRRFLDLAAAPRIPIFWLLPPFHPGQQAQIEFWGEDAVFQKFVHAMQDRSPNIVVIDGRHSGYDRTAFIDEVHLNAEGATAYTAGLAEVLARHGTGGSAEARWVKLPDYRTVLRTSTEKGSEASRRALDSSNRGRRR